MNSKVREASGHIGGFSDPLVDCKKCQNRERADQLIENMIPNIRTELYKKVSKLIKDVTDKKIKDDLFEYYELNRKIKDHFDEIGNFKKE